MMCFGEQSSGVLSNGEGLYDLEKRGDKNMNVGCQGNKTKT
jgi:hypothetical protein